MNLAKIRSDIASAQEQFEYVEAYPTGGGGVMALVALQTVNWTYTLAVNFPDTYPNSMPEVHIRKPALVSSPHRYNSGNICYLHPRMWNPGRHDLTFVIARAAKWLSKYEIYRAKGRWPGAGMAH